MRENDNMTFRSEKYLSDPMRGGGEELHEVERRAAPQT